MRRGVLYSPPPNPSSRFLKVEEWINRMGKFRVPGWLEKQVKLGRIDAVWIDTLKIVSEELEKTYPGEWDIHIKLNVAPRSVQVADFSTTPYTYEITNGHEYQVSFHPIIHIPETYIENGIRKHKIHDLFMKFNLKYDLTDPYYDDKDRGFIELLQGMRTSATLTELSARYQHSHISGTYGTGWQNFCLGSGEINETASSLTFSKDHSLDRNLFRLMLLQMKTVASWESIEGHPYHRISNIRNNAMGDGVYAGHAESNLANYTNAIIKHILITQPRINWKIAGQEFQIVDDNYFEQAIKWNGPDATRYSNTQNICKKNSRGEYVTFVPKSANTPSDYKPFWFRGKEVQFRVIGADPEEEKQRLEDQFYIIPQIKNYVKSRLESNVKKNLIRESIIARLSPQGNNESGDPGQDQVSVSEDQQSGVVGSPVLLSGGNDNPAQSDGDNSAGRIPTPQGYEDFHRV